MSACPGGEPMMVLNSHRFVVRHNHLVLLVVAIICGSLTAEGSGSSLYLAIYEGGGYEDQLSPP